MGVAKLLIRQLAPVAAAALQHLKRVRCCTLRERRHVMEPRPLRSTNPKGPLKRNCFTISTAPRQGIYIASNTPPATKYTPNVDATSTAHRVKGGGIPPLQQHRSRLVVREEQHQAEERAAHALVSKSRGPTPTSPPAASPPPVARTPMDDERGHIDALNRMPKDPEWTKRGPRISSTRRDTSLNRAAAATPPPGVYNVDRLPKPVGGKFSVLSRFSEDKQKLAVPGPGTYRSDNAPVSNTRGTDFAKCLPRTSAFESRALRNLPGPGTYDSKPCAFQPAHAEITPVAASFLAQRIPFDRDVAVDPAVLSDIKFVRNVARDIARQRLL